MVVRRKEDSVKKSHEKIFEECTFLLFNRLEIIFEINNKITKRGINPNSTERIWYPTVTFVGSLNIVPNILSVIAIYVFLLKKEEIGEEFFTTFVSLVIFIS